MDLYRIADAEELNETGFFDCLENGVCVVEWAERFPESLPARRVDVRIERTFETENARKITLTFRGTEASI
jgi:tRNA A37 threonylcarbamoyladenosine biosynthesis protein TsaE